MVIHTAHIISTIFSTSLCYEKVLCQSHGFIYVFKFVRKGAICFGQPIADPSPSSIFGYLGKNNLRS